MKIFLLWLYISFLSFPLLSSFAQVTVELPRDQWNPDVAVLWPEEVSWDEWTFFETLNLINRYLWFILGAVCMGVLVYWGIQLITASGEPEKMKKTNRLILGALIGILICILSYSVISLLINLF
jgi:hypothetical protein